MTISGVSLSALPGMLHGIWGHNAVSFICDNLWTHNGVQYAVWTDDQKHPTIGKRTLPDGAWSTFDLSTVAGNPLSSPTEDDEHNDYSLGVDADGFIHVAGNHHDDPLRYVRSTSAGDITAWEAPGMVGTDEANTTYPQFVKATDGEFLFIYRNGFSGNGAVYINAYDEATQTWTRRSKPLSGLVADGVDPDESPYLNRPAFAPDGTFHLFFMWRTTSDVTSSHDLCHMKSTDNGATWTKADGTALTLPVLPSTSPIIKAGWNYAINQSGATVDSSNRPHACWWLREAADSYACRLVHFWWTGTAWREDTEVKLGTAVETINVPRPYVFSHEARVFAIYSKDDTGHRTQWWCHDITPNVKRLPPFTIHNSDLGGYEPSGDHQAIAARDELHMLIVPTQHQPTVGNEDQAYASVAGQVLTLDLSDLAGALPRIPDDR